MDDLPYWTVNPNLQCLDCWDLYQGPDAPASPGQKIKHIEHTPQGSVFYDMSADDQPATTSHGYCPTCAEEGIRRWKEEQAGIASQREQGRYDSVKAQKRQEQRRFRRGRR